MEGGGSASRCLQEEKDLTQTETKKEFRLAILAPGPYNYHIPLYREIAQNIRVSSTVYFCSEVGAKEHINPQFSLRIKGDPQLLEGYQHKLLANISPMPSVFSCFGQVNPGIIYELWRGLYDAILVSGYTTATAWLAFLGAWMTRTPIIFRGETDLLLPRSRWKRTAKQCLLPRLFKRIDAFLFSCAANADYYRHYGVPDSKLFFCPCVVDNTCFQEQAVTLRSARAELKREAGILPESPVVLFVGKLIPRKRPLDLLHAFESMDHQCDGWVVFVGDGQLRPELQQYCKEIRLRQVYFAGFKNQLEIARFYAMADIFVLPSEHDPSPKVINEAMNLRLPVITTDRVGTAPDLIKHGENGFIYPVGDIRMLATHLSALIGNRGLRELMGKRSLEIVSDWSCEKDVAGILAALEYIRKTRAPATANA